MLSANLTPALPFYRMSHAYLYLYVYLYLYLHLYLNLYEISSLYLLLIMFAKCHPDILPYLRMSHCQLRSLSPSLRLNLWRDFFAIHWNVHVMYWSRPICRCSQSPWEVSKKLILSVAWLSPSFPPLLIRGANWNPVKKRRGHIGLWGLVGVAGLGPKDPPPHLDWGIHDVKIFLILYFAYIYNV